LQLRAALIAVVERWSQPRRQIESRTKDKGWLQLGCKQQNLRLKYPDDQI
jgi:hypothetical protein